MLAVPSKETPPIVLAVSRAVAVPALPETLPVTLPVRAPTTPPVAVVTPVMTAPPDRIHAAQRNILIESNRYSIRSRT